MIGSAETLSISVPAISFCFNLRDYIKRDILKLRVTVIEQGLLLEIISNF